MDLTKIPDLSYKPQKRKESTVRAELPSQVIRDESESDSIKRVVMLVNKAEKVAAKSLEVLSLMEEKFGSLAIPVDSEENPLIYHAMIRLFGDSFNGVITYKQYKQLLKVQRKVSAEELKDGLNA